MAAQVRERSVATGRFRESEFHWPLSGWQFEERPVASRPIAAGYSSQAARLQSSTDQSFKLG